MDLAVWKEFPAEARLNHSAVLLAPQRALICGGSTPISAPHLASCETVTLDAAGAPVVAPFAPLRETRAGLTLTLLAPGRVLAFGGSSAMQSFYGASVGEDGAWSDAEASAVSRADHTAALLGDTVVIVGGATSRGFLDTLGLRSESGEWSNPGPFDRRVWHTATVLQSGRELLVVGGRNQNAQTLTAAAIFTLDGGFRSVRDLPGPRCRHTATLLADGSVLVVGGVNERDVALGSAYRYDVERDEWLPAGSIPARSQHGAARLGPYVIVAGGESYNQTVQTRSDVYAFDGGADAPRWVELAPMHQPRAAFQLLALDERHVLASGGSKDLLDPATSELFTPLALGESCSDGQSCVLGTCVDEICCNRPCTGPCESCTEPGSEGICTAVSGERGTCSGGNICQQGSCGESCSSERDCSDGYYCRDGECTQELADGEPCTLDGACASGICADGVCCEARCSGQCESCNQRRREGVCWPVPAGQQPIAGREPCGGSTHEACAASCDGGNVVGCAYPKPGTACGEATCSEQGFSKAPTCNGEGDCVAAKPRSCAPYTCDAEEGCGNGCGTDQDCTGGTRCKDGQCRVPCDCDRDEICENGECVPACVEAACNTTGYRCHSNAAVCRTTCTRSETDCAGGYYCHPFQQACVKFVPFPTAQLPSCTLGHAPSRSPVGLAGVAALFLLWRSRRKNR